MTRARTAPSVGNDRGLWSDPLSPQERGELGGGLQRPVVGIEKLGPIQVDSSRQVPEPGRSIPPLLRPLELADAAYVPDDDAVVIDGGLRLVSGAVDLLYHASCERPRFVGRDVAGKRQPLGGPLR